MSEARGLRYAPGVTRRRLAALVTLAALAIGGIGIALAVLLPGADRAPASGSVTAVGAPNAPAGVDDFRFARGGVHILQARPLVSVQSATVTDSVRERL